MKFKKNLFAAFIGSIIGIIILMFYLFIFYIPANADKIGLAIIALLPVLVILFSILGIIVGAISGIIIYQIIKG